MRDKNRISKILNELERIWLANPDFRLGQLIVVGTKTKQGCPEVFNIEDEKLIQGLLSFENRAESKNQKTKTPGDWQEYTNISRIDPNELTIELLTKLIDELKTANKEIIITPINLMRLNGAPVSDQTWLLNQKLRSKKLKRLLIQLKENRILEERKSKQDFKGIKETGYDIIK